MSLHDKVIAVVSRVIKVHTSDLTADSGLSTVNNWDSLNHTTLVLELEKEFDVAFDFDELDQIVTVKAITLSLKNKGVSD